MTCWRIFSSSGIEDSHLDTRKWVLTYSWASSVQGMFTLVVQVRCCSMSIFYLLALCCVLCIGPYVAFRVLCLVKPESKVSAGFVLEIRVLTVLIGAKLYICQKLMTTSLTAPSL